MVHNLAVDDGREVFTAAADHNGGVGVRHEALGVVQRQLGVLDAVGLKKKKEEKKLRKNIFKKRFKGLVKLFSILLLFVVQSDRHKGIFTMSF